ncbi:mucin-2-like [Helianthus annuus]|uniref:mucin-2-like n=1 Tax=Helianthus annuus TaxID=4232 RepID=UPI000B904997|nr:mucin-2-like [Helianthus annuus]
MASDQNVADQTMTNNNLTLGANLGTTTQPSPAVTRSLDPEFEAEGPPPGFDNITTVSSQTVVTSPFLYMPSQLQSRELGGASGNMFTPATTTNAQASRLSSIPVIASASHSAIALQTSMPQYYQPLISNSMPPLYSAALTATLSTPPHQPVVMPAGVMNAPVTPGNQVYFQGYCYAPPYGYLHSYGGSAYPLQGTAQGSTQSPYAAYMPPWWNVPTPQPVYTQTPPTAEPVYDRGNTVRPRVSQIGNPSPIVGAAPGMDTPPTQPINVDEDELTRPYKPVDATFRSKFTRRIAEAPIKEKPKMPQTVGKYDGLVDPDDHLNLFKSAGEVAC